MTSKYCVAYVNLFDNVLKQDIIEAESEVDACVKYLVKITENTKYPLDKEYEADLRKFTDVMKLQEDCFNTDFLIHAIKISV